MPGEPNKFRCGSPPFTGSPDAKPGQEKSRFETVSHGSPAKNQHDDDDDDDEPESTAAVINIRTIGEHRMEHIGKKGQHKNAPQEIADVPENKGNPIRN